MSETEIKLRLMTKAEFAEHEYQKFAGHPCSPPFLSKPEMVELLAPAMHPDPEDARKQLIDADAALELLKKNAGARYVPPDGETPAAEMDDDSPRKSGRFTAAKEESAEIDVKLKRLQLERELGNTLHKDDVRAAFASSWQILRELMKARNPDVVAKLAGLTSDREKILLLDQEDRALQEKVRDELRKRGQPVEISSGEAAGS